MVKRRSTPRGFAATNQPVGEARLVSVKIKLKRLGKIHKPQYRVVIADSRTARNGRAIEEIGTYQPMEEPSVIQINSDRAQYWLGVGAQPTDAVLALLKVTGDWQKFKGLPGAEGTLKVAEPKQPKIVAYEAAVKDAADAPKEAPKPKPVVEEKPITQEAEASAELAEEVAAEEVVAEAVVEEAAVEEAAVEEAAAEAEVVAEAEEIVVEAEAAEGDA